MKSELYIQFISLLPQNETRPHYKVKLIGVFRGLIAVCFENYPSLMD